MFKLKIITYFLLLIFPLLVIVVHIAWIKKSQNDAATELSLIETSFQSVLQKYQYLPALLASDTRLKIAVDYTNEEPQLNTLLKSMQSSVGIDVLYLMNEKGTVIAASNYESPGSFMGNNYHFRPYFQQALEEGNGSYYGVGVTTSVPGFFISSRVEGYNAGVGVVVAKIEPSQLEQTWKTTDGTVFLVDENNTVLMSLNSDWKYNSLTTLSEEQLQTIKAQRMFAGYVPQLLVEKKINVDFFSFSIWCFSDEYYLVQSNTLEYTGNLTRKSWKIYYAKPYVNVIKKTVYSACVIAFFLYSIFLFLKHQYVLNYTRTMEREADERRRAQLQLTIDNTQVGLLTLDEKGVILSSNPVFRTMVGCTQGADLERKKVSDIIDITHDGSIGLMIQTELFIESQLHKIDNCVLPVMFCVCPMNIDDSVCLMTIVNISKRKNAEEKLRNINAKLEKLVEKRTSALKSAQQELLRQEKMVVLGRMASAIVHEMSQPLVSFKSALASVAIKMQRKDWQGVNVSLENMLPLCDKMQDVIVQLRSFGYQGQLDTQVVDINALLIKIIETRMEGNNVLVDIIPDKKPLLINVNLTKIEIALDNLIRNAFDAIKLIDNSHVQVTTKKLKNNVSIIIEDNGGSIAEDVAEHIFEPFYTTKTMGEGLGLGLSIANNIVKEYQGEINLEYSRLMTRFIVTLPLIQSNEFVSSSNNSDVSVLNPE